MINVPCRGTCSIVEKMRLWSFMVMAIRRELIYFTIFIHIFSATDLKARIQAWIKEKTKKKWSGDLKDITGFNYWFPVYYQTIAYPLLHHSWRLGSFQLCISKFNTHIFFRLWLIGNTSLIKAIELSFIGNILGSLYTASSHDFILYNSLRSNLKILDLVHGTSIKLALRMTECHCIDQLV